MPRSAGSIPTVGKRQTAAARKDRSGSWVPSVLRIRSPRTLFWRSLQDAVAPASSCTPRNAFRYCRTSGIAIHANGQTPRQRQTNEIRYGRSNPLEAPPTRIAPLTRVAPPAAFDRRRPRFRSLRPSSPTIPQPSPASSTPWRSPPGAVVHRSASARCATSDGTPRPTSSGPTSSPMGRIACRWCEPASFG